MKPIQRYEFETLRCGASDMFRAKLGDWMLVEPIYIELVRLYRRTGSQEVYEVSAAIGKALRFGLNCYDPTVPTNQRELNSERVLREADDSIMALIAAVEAIRKHNETT